MLFTKPIAELVSQSLVYHATDKRGVGVRLLGVHGDFVVVSTRVVRPYARNGYRSDLHPPERTNFGTWSPMASASW